MIFFNCDYTEGAHPKVMDRLLETNLVQTDGYGEDPYCMRAREIIVGIIHWMYIFWLEGHRRILPLYRLHCGRIRGFWQRNPGTLMCMRRGQLNPAGIRC